MAYKCVTCMDSGCEACTPKEPKVSESPSLPGLNGLQIDGFVVVDYPEGEMEQASVFFSPEQLQEAKDLVERYRSKGKVELLARIAI